MDILYIVPYVPSLIRVRPYNLIHSLAEQDHKITLLTLWTTDSERDEIGKIKQYCERVYAIHLPRWRSLLNCAVTVPSGVPLQAVYCWQPDLARELTTMIANCNGRKPFDVIHIEHLRGVRYGLHARLSDVSTPVVWDSVDCISHLFRQAARQSKKPLSRLITQFELRRTERYESWLLTQFDRVIVTSQADKEAFINLTTSPTNNWPLSVLPNGVDLDYFSPGGDDQREPATLVISGKMSYHANVSMAMHLYQSILPLIWEHEREVKLWIVGKDPPPEIREIGKHPAITVTGTVDDIRPYLRRATVAVAPLTYGAGIQNKVLEAMGCATPVVTTPRAVPALSVNPGEDILVAQEPLEFAKKVLMLIKDPDTQREVGEAGRQYVERNHRWDKVARQLEGIYNEVIGTRI
jgi:sugar transferase (PEP-CTERM/EpsH1 system associated)